MKLRENSLASKWFSKVPATGLSIAISGIYNSSKDGCITWWLIFNL